MLLASLPKQDGFRMPGEFEPHEGCLMIWPRRPGSWPFGARAARNAFAAVARSICRSETLWMLVWPEDLPEARRLLPPSVRLVPLRTDDAWARDVGPTFLLNREGVLRGVNWEFNAWGGEYDGLYPHWEQDNEAAPAFCRVLGADCYDARPFVLEGGSIHSDGEGTILTTEPCLLSPGRNPALSKTEIEEKLRAFLGADAILWLPRGIAGDETNEHVDNICAFTRPGEVVLAWTDDPRDPQYACSHACLEALSRMRDARGRRLRVHKLPIPARPVCIQPEELAGFSFEEGEDRREAGERLAASYVNFYIANRSVLIPQFGDPNDGKALEILGALFPDREPIPIAARDILVGGGNIHCITQQIPKGEISHV